MFAAGEKIIYGESGVCTIEKIAPISASEPDKLYYHLTPLVGTGTYFSPVSSNAFMREIISAEQAEALISGGVDIILIETCFDALNVKAALAAVSQMNAVPVMISVSVGDRSGRTLTGQTLEAFYTSVRHYPIMSFGLNCSLGASELMPLIEDLSSWC